MFPAMETALTTRAEMLAQEAEQLVAFSGLKLLHIRTTVGEILSQLGRNGFFAEYTLHDISHIDALLALQSWLVPEDVWQRLSPADALLQVLAIYFHDLGLLVTEDEFRRREASSFPAFKAERLENNAGTDYREKVLALGPETAERFLYQEYVRTHHGERIRAWVNGTVPADLGASDAVVAEVAALLNGLPAPFRADLGMVCESHHRDDLGQTDKYHVSKPYGRSEAETANVQYAAIILRTADLLHITSDRTPSVAFNLISPADPVSQQEWAKQRAVANVRSKVPVNREGDADPTAPRNTIEVFAEFTDESGFFGLSAYLTYAQRQLEQSYKWAKDSVRHQGSAHTFPWRFIDESQIQTKGFLRQSFEFELDQGRVLDLLTGHTLYNNTNVVVRELVQNSLDAIRLKEAQSEAASCYKGHVNVHWDSHKRRLTVADNGTGMTQDVIEKHLLTVGASRYQDPEFCRENPDFSPISRFGIGILSAFMIADAVTIITADAGDEHARRLSLRSVHGRYLIRLLAKNDHGSGIGRDGHGTKIELDLRPSADIGDVEQILRDWVVIPRCAVNLTVDDGDPVAIGFESVGDALRAYLVERGIDIETKTRPVKIVEQMRAGVTLAFAVRWSQYYKQWSFIRVDTQREQNQRPLGTCVEGIRVENTSPGYRQVGIAAMADAVGLEAPKTNVARSGLEHSPERRRALKRIYQMYFAFVQQEVDALFEDRGCSLTWAAGEAQILAAPLLSSSPEERSILAHVASELRSLVVDDDGRKLASPQEVSALPQVWTVESAFFRSAESLLRETSTTASITAVVRALGTEVAPPAGPLLPAGPHTSRITAAAFEGKDVAKLIIRRDERRVDLGWEAHGGEPRWLRLKPDLSLHPDIAEEVGSMPYGDRRVAAIQVAGVRVAVEGIANEIAVRSYDALYLVPHAPLAEYLYKILERLGTEGSRDALVAQLAIFNTVAGCLQGNAAVSAREAADFMERICNFGGRLRMREQVERFTTLNEFAEVIAAGPVEIFDVDAWSR